MSPTPPLSVRRPTWLIILGSLRPEQWSKNVLCLAGTFFSGRLFELDAVISSLLLFLCFSLLSSSVYLFNDLRDLEQDRLHPRKRHRALASGAMSPWVAVVLVIVLALTALGLCCSLLGASTTWSLITYGALNVAYSVRLKHVVLLDILPIALGFVLRFVAGVYAIDELPTTWSTVCTFFLAVFLAACKRRAEFAAASDVRIPQRPVLTEYSLPFLDALVAGAAVMAVISYGLFTTSGGKDPSLIVTLPFVYYGIAHYTRMVMAGTGGERPEHVLLVDRRIQVTITLWLLAYVLVEQGRLTLFR